MSETLPTDVKEALQAAGLSEFFADCTAAHRREYLRWIGEAKRPETRAKRIAQAMLMIAAKRAEEAAKG
jgi:uncharacterized protein YdeI (YjbR/CyaY-like superfamily)